MLRLPDSVLVVLVGPAASGKSSWAAEHVAADQVVSSDRLRAVVGTGEHDLAASTDAFAVLDQVVAARVRRRLTTVVDTLGLDADRRRTWRELARAAGVPCVAVVFDTPAAECRRRNAARPHRVPAAVLTAQLSSFPAVRAALETERFDQVLTAQPVRVVPASVAAAARVVAESAPSVVAESGPSVRAASVGSAPSAAPEKGRLRFGLQVSAFDAPGGPAQLGEHLRAVAVAAEEAGFSSLWVMDHMRQAPQLGRVWDDMLESTTALGHLAAVTSRVTVGALVHGVTYRNLAHLGKIVATLDVLSGGRAVCGLGLGWYAEEHAAYGWRLPSLNERYALLEDALQLFPLLWGPGSPAFSGRVVSVPEALCYPRPLQAQVPILVGGSGERRTLRLVARYADACNLFGDVDVVRHKVEVLRAHCAEVDRDPAEVEVTHLGSVLVGRDDAEVAAALERRGRGRGGRTSRLVTPGTVEDHVLRARALQAVGVQHVIVSLADVWEPGALERFADVIGAAVS